VDAESSRTIDSWGALLVRSRGGDELAFEELVRACERRVVMIAYQITGNLQDAQDVAQESFLRVYRSRDRFQDGRSFEAWLYRIVVNQSRKSLARARRQRVDPLDDAAAASIPAEGTPSPHESAAAESLSETMKGLLEELSPRLRSVFVLRDLQGMETAEIARILSCAEATVRRHSAESRIRLRRLLEERHPGIQRKS
jgi:RNA polymerase sigma-70 factor (ECF subfamily)